MDTLISSINPSAESLLQAAIGGDQEAFGQLVEPYQHELIVHGYRFLGSLEDAEDILQETLLRAWRRLDTFEGRSSFRAWLYKICTNAALDAIDSRKRRAMPTELYSRGDPKAPLPPKSRDIHWVEPLPDELIDNNETIYPEARYEIRESINLAFVAALQHLPGRQRAVLLLRDVMGWNTSETAETLGLRDVVVNSLLQRARAAMQQRWNRRKERQNNLPAGDEIKTSLLQRYLAAWEAADATALVDILCDDVALTMPPYPVWFGGSADVKTFLEEFIFKYFGQPRLLPIRANGSPAFAIYHPDGSGVYRLTALHILGFKNNKISEIHDFLELSETMIAKFGISISL